MKGTVLALGALLASVASVTAAPHYPTIAANGKRMESHPISKRAPTTTNKTIVQLFQWNWVGSHLGKL